MKANYSYRYFVLTFLFVVFLLNLLIGVHQVNAQGSLILAADMVRGSENPMGPVCALTSRYKQGEHVVWRVRIIDSSTGKAVPAPAEELLGQNPSKEDLASMTKNINVVVHLSDGHIFPMHFGPHPSKKAADYFWTTGWIIPKNFPTGTLDYWITADWSAEGKAGRWEPFNVGYSKLTIEEKW
ncbi:MAG: hypothetical protein PVF26_21545 [Desulfobacterales bacterium]|jgi:hypothetical protein